MCPRALLKVFIARAFASVWSRVTERKRGRSKIVKVLPHYLDKRATPRFRPAFMSERLPSPVAPELEGVLRAALRRPVEGAKVSERTPQAQSRGAGGSPRPQARGSWAKRSKSWDPRWEPDADDQAKPVVWRYPSRQDGLEPVDAGLVDGEGYQKAGEVSAWRGDALGWGPVVGGAEVVSLVTPQSVIRNP